MEVKLKAHQCSSCKYEFVVVSLNKEQAWAETPFCPLCGDEEFVAQIDCLDFTLVEKVQQY